MSDFRVHRLGLTLSLPRKTIELAQRDREEEMVMNFTRALRSKSEAIGYRRIRDNEDT